MADRPDGPAAPVGQSDEPGPPVPGSVPSAATGDEMLQMLYREYRDPLLGYVTRLTNDRQRAQDIVQETLLRAWRHASDLRSDAPSLRGWLYRVARNIVIDDVRARQARPQEVSHELAMSAPTNDRVDDILTSIEVTQALDSLKPQHRQILIEVFYRGRTVAEAATVLGIPRGTAKSRLFYAMRLLRMTFTQTREGSA
jgi:RNA polymerase sigma-70 factor (ECF subfamily)